jgi:hypothetical protein
MFVATLVALTALALAGGTVAFILPQRSEANSLQQSIAAAQARLAVASAPQNTPVNAGDAAAQVFQLGAAMPESADMPGILIQLSALAAQSAVKVTAITPSALVPGSAGYSTLPISLTLDGKYAAITKFLGLMRKAVNSTSAGLAVHGRLFIVNQIQLQPESGSSGAATSGSVGSGPSTTSAPNMLQATLQLDAFVYGTAPPQTTSTSTTTTSG